MCAAHAGPQALIGTLLGSRYRVIQWLGSGGVGDVYLAERIGFGRSRQRVAVKLLRADPAPPPAVVARFEREAQAAASVCHPNVLEVFELGRTDSGFPFFSMELLVGLDLADTIAQARTLHPARAVRIAHGVALGLAAAHAAGVIHRDVKPENIFLVHAPDGSELVKLLDFGLAWTKSDDKLPGNKRITMRRTVVGTPEYMSPEQASGAIPAPAFDVYSLGIVLYELLAGRVPFIGDYPAVARQHALQTPPPMQTYNPALVISTELAELVSRALAKDLAHRIPSAAAFAGALASTPEARERRDGTKSL